MSSDVEICNMSLGHVGVAYEIGSLEEESTEAEQCKRYYEQTRDELLRAHEWPFSVRYRTLNLVEQDPNSDWAYSYRYPNGCLRMIRLVTAQRTSTRVPWEIGHDDIGRLIYTDEADAIARFIERVTNELIFDESFIETFVWRLASKLAIPLSRSEKERDYAFKRYEMELARCSSTSFNEVGSDAPLEAEAVRMRE